MKKYKFNKKADKFLEDLYNSVGAKTWEQKYNTTLFKLGYKSESVSFSHDPTWEQKTGMMEYDLLEGEGLITLVYA